MNAHMLMQKLLHLGTHTHKWGAVRSLSYILYLNISFYSLWGALHVLLFNTLVFMTLMAHVRAVFSDPGIVPLPQSRLDFSDMHAGKYIIRY